MITVITNNKLITNEVDKRIVIFHYVHILAFMDIQHLNFKKKWNIEEKKSTIFSYLLLTKIMTTIPRRFDNYLMQTIIVVLSENISINFDISNSNRSLFMNNDRY